MREAFADWVGQARGAAKRLAAFGSRACLVEAPHTDCSWVAGAQLQPLTLTLTLSLSLTLP